ncbi:hypothetical protein TNCV_3674201 [Trichonephila clavipes]|nr:hypothetical protein TNCV_3674201 [Trichonephila clavipes]
MTKCRRGCDALATNGVVTLDPRPYSPHLAPADLFLFPRLKSALMGIPMTYILVTDGVLSHHGDFFEGQ